MRIPKRKAEEDNRKLRAHEPLLLTPEGVEKMSMEIARLQSVLPALREEVSTTKEMGDLSENAGYQIAKANLRRTQSKLDRLLDDQKFVTVLRPTRTDKVEAGSFVTIERDDREELFRLVGSREVDPKRGYVSLYSPLGSLLLNARFGDERVLPNGQKMMIKKIEATHGGAVA